MTDALFHCTRLHMDLRPEACAALHRKHRRTSDTIACRRCEVGAQNAGLPVPSVEALWPFRDIRPGDVVAGATVLARHPFLYGSTMHVWVQWPSGEQTDRAIESLRRWKRRGVERAETSERTEEAAE